MPDGTKVTYSVTDGGDATTEPITLTTFQGRTSVEVGFGRRVEEARVEAIVRDDGDGIVEPGELIFRATVSKPCFSQAPKW